MVVFYENSTKLKSRQSKNSINTVYCFTVFLVTLKEHFYVDKAQHEDIEIRFFNIQRCSINLKFFVKYCKKNKNWLEKKKIEAVRSSPTKTSVIWEPYTHFTYYLLVFGYK